jgi:hypothetical protein
MLPQRGGKRNRETGLAGPVSPHTEKPSSAAATRSGSVETL